MKNPVPLLTLLAAGCSAAPPAYVPTPAPKAEPVAADAPLMPLVAGSEWTYAMQTEELRNGRSAGKKETVATYRVEKAQNGEATLLLESGGKTIDAQGLRVATDGLYQTSSSLNSVPTVPPQPLALLPLKAGRRFSWKGKAAMPDGTISQGAAESEILAEQAVDTAAGPVSAIPVQTHLKFPSGESESLAWYRPGVGLVRYRQATSSRNVTVVLLLTLTSAPTPKRP